MDSAIYDERRFYPHNIENKYNFEPFELKSYDPDDDVGRVIKPLEVTSPANYIFVILLVLVLVCILVVIICPTSNIQNNAVIGSVSYNL